MQDFVACKVPFFGGTEPKLFLLKRETRKIVLVMKITAVLLLAAVLQVSAKSWGQEKITLSFNNAPLEQVLNSIHSQANVEFIYRTDYVKDKKVTVNVSNASLKTVLDLCLQNQQLTYDIFGKNVSIHPEKREGKDGKPSENLVSGVSGPVDVTGRVTDPQGEPISGANVVIKRTSSGTITNANGQFTLKNVNTDDVILISYVGYSPLSIKVGDKTTFLLVMQIAANKLDAAVVQAYGKTTERLRTGNIATVTSAEIERQPVMNILQALQARVPGLVITQTSGYASAPYKIELRGRSSLNNNLPVEPLFIIDGVPFDVLSLDPNQTYEGGSKGLTQNGLSGPAGGQSPLYSINPDDIESVTVLKDADALSIYGSRGANGVILVTTKKGAAGKTKFDIDAFSGVSMVTSFYKLLNTREYLQMRREAFVNSGEIPTINNAYDLFTWDTTRYTDWQKYFWGDNANFQKAQMAISGGDRNTNFRISAAYTRLTNISTFSGAENRASLQFNLNHKSLDQRLGISFTNIFSFSKVDLISFPGSVLLPPNAPPVFNNYGKLNYSEWAPAAFNFETLLEPYVARTRFLNSQLRLDYRLLKGLTLSNDIGFSTNVTSQNQIFPISSQDPSNNPKGRSTFGNNNSTRIILEPQLEYKGFLKKGEYSILVGGTYQSTRSDGNVIRGIGYTNDNLLYSISNATNKFASDVWGEYKYNGAFSRINYNWENKYIINLSARRDGSSKFGSGKQFGNFGSAGLAWIFSNENWVKNIKILSFGKLRASYGHTGSDVVGNYFYLSRWSSTNSYQQGNPAYIPLQHANPNLQWQTDKKLEFGINLGFLQDRLLFEVVWYRNRVDKQLIDYNLPSATGFNYITANFPAVVQNSGWEPSFTAKLMKTKNWEWSINSNISFNKNKLLSFPGIENSPYATTYVVGQSLYVTNVLHYTGLDRQTGLYTYQDINKDGVITSYFEGGDMIKIDRSIKYSGGFGTDISYKGIQLNLFFQFQKRLLRNALYTTGWPGSINNIPFAVYSDHWQKPGDNARFARFSTIPGDNDMNYFVSDAGYSNTYFIRLNNLSLSYNLPKQFSTKLKMQSAMIYLRGENLFKITNYEGADPETAQFGALPPLTSLTAGFKFQF